MHRGKSLYLICTYNPHTGTYSSTAYNGKGNKKPAFRQLSIPEREQLEAFRSPNNPKKEVYRCVHVTNARNIPSHINAIHEKAAPYSNAKQKVK